MKKRLIIVTACVLLALTPAVAGAVGNTSLSHRIPVSGPVVTVEPGDDNGGLVSRDQRTEPGDDRDASASPPTATPAPAAAAQPAPVASASPGATHDAGDDHGGLVPRDQRTEPGDDRDARSGSDDGSGHGGDDGPGHDAGDDNGGSRHGD